MKFSSLCFLSVALILGFQVSSSNIHRNISWNFNKKNQNNFADQCSIWNLGSIFKTTKANSYSWQLTRKSAFESYKLVKFTSCSSTCVNIKNYPTINEDVARYKDQQKNKTIPECCEPDQFPAIFQLTYDLFSCIENIFKSLGGGLCDLVKLLSPLGCRQKAVKDLSQLSSVGCLLKSLLGWMFGELCVPIVSL